MVKNRFLKTDRSLKQSLFVSKKSKPIKKRNKKRSFNDCFQKRLTTLPK